MYDDSWFVLSDPRREDTAPVASSHRRRESLLQQPNDGPQIMLHPVEDELLEQSPMCKGPPKATLRVRARSFHNKKQQSSLIKKAAEEKLKSDLELSILNGQWYSGRVEDRHMSSYSENLDASQEEFILYRNQLRLTERHLDTLVEDTTAALDLLAGLTKSFDAVEKETTAFQSQCQVLLDDQKSLKRLSDEVSDDLKHYSYLEPITRRLNAPGASRLVRDPSFVEMLANLNNCIWFMSQHPEHRESETYKTRYISLLGRALNLFESQLTKDLNERLEDIRKRRAEGSLNEATLHALLYRAMSSEMEYNLRFIGQWAAGVETLNLGDYSSSESFPLLQPNSPARGFARAQVENNIRGIVSWRRELIDPMVQGFIDALNGAFEKKDDAMKASRTCIKAVLDLIKEELQHIHLKFFAGFWEVQGHVDPLEPYTVYLNDACKQVTGAVSQIVRLADLQEAVELTNWVERCYVTDFSQYKSQKEDEDTTLFEATRRQITWKMSRQIKDVILSRFRDIVLRKIEMYEPTEGDLEIAPVFIDQRESLSGSKEGPSSDARQIPSATISNLDSRAIEIIGEGFLTAYPPVKSAIRMLILHNEMFPASSDDDTPVDSERFDLIEKSRFEIIHHTVNAVSNASGKMLQADVMAQASAPQPAKAKATAAHRGNPRTGYHNFLFGIHNLYLLKQLILIYELHGVTRTSELDFTEVWTTLRDLRERGQLLDPRAYYNLLRDGKLMPRVFERVSDARVELDGVLRRSIVKFTEGWALRITDLWKAEGRTDGGGEDDACFAELRWILGWTLVGERQLMEGLFLAVYELCIKGISESWRLPLRISQDKSRPSSLS